MHSKINVCSLESSPEGAGSHSLSGFLSIRTSVVVTCSQAQQYTVQDYLATRACFEENPRWRADLDRVVFTARPGASAETKGVSFSQSDKHATDKGGLQSQAKQSQPKEKVPSAPQAVFISSDSEDDSSGDSVKIMHVRTPSQNELHPPFAANQDYDGMIINNPLWTASEPAYRGLFDPDDFRVAVKVPGGPDRLKLLIRQSLATGSIEELRRAERRHNTGQPPAAGLQASAARRETQVLLANIKQQLQARLDCQQQEWQAPMRYGWLGMPTQMVTLTFHSSYRVTAHDHQCVQCNTTTASSKMAAETYCASESITKFVVAFYAAEQPCATSGLSAASNRILSESSSNETMLKVYMMDTTLPFDDLSVVLLDADPPSWNAPATTR